MNNESLLNEIREANLTYLLLAQQMLREDRAAAMFRLGISEDVAGIIERLAPSQIARMAQSSLLLFRLRVDDRAVFDLLGERHKAPAMAQTHAAIVMAARTPETVS